MRNLAATEAARDLDLVALFYEAADVLDLEIEIVVVRLGPNLDLLQFDAGLALASVALPLLLLVLELAEVHDLAHGRVCLRVHLHEIKAGFTRELLGFRSVEHSEHFALRAHQANLRNTNAVIDARTKIPPTLRAFRTSTNGSMPPAAGPSALNFVMRRGACRLPMARTLP